MYFAPAAVIQPTAQLSASAQPSAPVVLVERTSLLGRALRALRRA